MGHSRDTIGRLTKDRAVWRKSVAALNVGRGRREILGHSMGTIGRMAMDRTVWRNSVAALNVDRCIDSK